MTEVEDVTVILLPCAVCGRTFRPEILSKHANVCERQHTKKRKKFDSAKQRIQGTELAEFLGPPPLTNMPTKPKPPSPKKAPSRWKEKHEALIRASKDDHTKPSDHSQCPHCDRYFGPKAFDRHESWCKEQHSKIQVQNNDVTKAKKRLHARTKYRAPSFKSQRSVTKEKYSPARPPVSSTSSILPSALFEQHDRLHRQTSSVSATEVEVTSGIGGTLGRKSPGLTRQNSMPRHSRRNEEEPIKREVPGAKKQEELPTLTRISRAGSLSSQGSDNRSQGTSSSHSVGPCDTGMGSVGTPLHETKPTIKTSFSTNRDLERYDPFITAELQMMELLRSDEGKSQADPSDKTTQNISDKMTQSATEPISTALNENIFEKMSSSTSESRKNSFDKIMPIITNKRTQSASCKTDSILTKRVTRASTNLNKEKVPSKRAQSSDGMRRTGNDSRKHSLEPLPSDTFRGQGKGVSSPFRTSPTSTLFPSLKTLNNDNDSTPILNNNNKDTNENEEFKMLSLSTLSLCSEGSLETLEPNLRTRCSSALPRQTKQKLNMHDLLFGLDNNNDEPNSKSRTREVERCEAQLLRSMVEFELLLNRDNLTPSPVATPPPNLVADSAYSSLNRRWSPSGGEQMVGSAVSAQDPDGALSKFCHECGGRYPVAGAKFCCLCGVRRLAI